MGFENKPYRDEDGEPLVDLGKNVEGNEPQQHDLGVAFSNRSESSIAPVKNGSNLKRRKLVIKIKSGIESGPKDLGLDDNGIPGSVRDDSKRKRDKGDNKKSMGKKRKEENIRSLGKKGKVEKGEKKPRAKKSGRGRMTGPDADSEIKEMWDTVVGGNSEDGQDGIWTVDEDNFIDDSDVDPSYHYGSDNEHSPRRAPQAEEAEVDEIEELFKIGKKKKKEICPSKISLLAESVIAELNVAAEEDAELNRQEKPAITKLNKLSLLTDIIPRKHLQQELLRRGVLIALRQWLEPLPDKSIPNINIRAAVFKCLNDLTIDLKQFDQREIFRASRIGKAVMFYYKYDEETTSNRKLAKELVDKWSRDIFNISISFEDLLEDKRTCRVPPVRKAMSNEAARVLLDDDLLELSQGRKSGPSTSRQHASRPEAVSMDFMVRPQSNVDPEAVQAREKLMAQNQPRAKLNKKLQKLSAPKRKQLQAVKLSLEGRGMVKYV